MSGLVWVLLFWVGLWSGLKLSGTSSLGFGVLGPRIHHYSKETFEVYSINGNQVIRKLGYFNEVYKFVWANDINRNFIERRSNFLGLQLKAVTDRTGNDVIFDSKYKKNAPYFANNDTFWVNGYTSGGCPSLKYENGF